MVLPRGRLRCVLADAFAMLAAPLARVAEWQTRRTQNPLFERTCGFESHLGHHGWSRSEDRGPVVLHADDRPILRSSSFQRLLSTGHVGKLTFRVVVQH